MKNLFKVLVLTYILSEVQYSTHLTPGVFLCFHAEMPESHKSKSDVSLSGLLFLVPLRLQPVLF